MKINNTRLFVSAITTLLLLACPLSSIAENAKNAALKDRNSYEFYSTHTCDVKCQQHIQSMLDTYRIQHQTLATQMSIGLSDHSIMNFNSGTLTDPKVDPQAKNIANDSLLKLNSITKTFTAAMIFQLESEGKLSTNDTVGKWFSNEYPEWKNITIDQLVHMTSGIYEYGVNEKFTDEVDKDWSHIWPSEDLINFAYYDDGHNNPHPWCTTSSCPIQPGHGWVYNNTNYVLLTRIIEKASGQTYKKNLDDRIIKNPAIGFDKNTIIYDPDNAASNPDKLKNMVHVYYQSRDLTSFPISIERGAGGIIANTENLVKWFQALFNGKVLSPKAFDKMKNIVCEDDEGVGSCASIDSQGHIIRYQPGDPMPNDMLTNNGYSSGFFTAIYPNLTNGDFIWQSNGGDQVGYVSSAVYFKDAKIVIGLMENNPDHALDAENFIFDIKKYLMQQG